MQVTKPQSSTEQDEALLVSNTVKLWTKRIKDAKKFYERDFKRMRENMEFAAGIQWSAQDTIESNQYVANFVNREVNQKVANLYAKDPKAVFRRRKRLDYQLWDGSIESMQAAHMTVMQAQQMAMQNPLAMQQPQVIQAQALLADIQHGRAWNKMVEKVGQSLELLYAYECDTQAPDFKYQMKQLVRRVVTTGVGFVRLNFSRQGDYALTSSGTDDSVSMRIKRAKQILDQIDDGDVDESDPRHEQLKALFSSVQDAAQTGAMQNIEERLEFDFPSATSVIVDPKCKSLKGFVGARWIAQQYILPLEDVNAYFETAIEAGGKLVKYSEDGIEKLTEKPGDNTKDPQEKPLCCLWEVFDVLMKSVFFLADGWDEYVQEPQPTQPSINRFWPIFALTFNDVEVEPGGKVHIYPPSDVELLRHPQKSWNTSREELNKHRKQNRPWYATLEGWLTDSDHDKIGNHESGELVSFKGVPPNGSLRDNLLPFASSPIDPSVYNTQPYLEDSGLVIGSNQAGSTQPQKHVAATPAVIQEQARMSGVNSNVDDLDDLLAELARAAGEMLLREFSLDTVKRIVGVGAVWPEQNREDFLNEVYLDIVAASSGRPNKAVDVANAQQLGPLMLQAGANPWALIKMYCKVLDANIEPEDFAPTAPPAQPGQGAGGAAPAKGVQPQPMQQPGLVGQQLGGLGHPAGAMRGGAH